MAFPPLEGSLQQVPSRYQLVVLAAKRARQLNRGAPARVESTHHKAASRALEEVAAGKVEYQHRTTPPPEA